MLETVTDPDRVNIGNLNLEEPRPADSLFFDPEKEIPARVKADMFEFVASLTHFRRAYELEILFPGEVDLTQTQPNARMILLDSIYQDKETILGREERLGMREMAMDNFIEDTRQFRVLFPESFEETGLKDWDFFQSVLQERQTKAGVNAFQLLTARLLFPKESKEMALSEETVESIAGAIRHERTVDTRFVDGWNDAARWAAVVKLVQPDKMDDLGLDQKAYQEMKETWTKLLSAKNPQPEQLITEAMSLKILSAAEIKFTENGLELIMPQPKAPLTEEIPSLPEVRKF